MWFPILLRVVPRFHYHPGAVRDAPSEGPSVNRLAYTQFSPGFQGCSFLFSLGSVSFSWSPSSRGLLRPPILQQPNPEPQVTVEVDGSNTGMGQVPTQRSFVEGTVTALASVDCPYERLRDWSPDSWGPNPPLLTFLVGCASGTLADQNARHNPT